MPATFQLIPSPIGSQFIRLIGDDDPDDLNDFVVYVVASENVSGLALSDFSFRIIIEGRTTDITDRGSLLSLEGKGSVYELRVRPPSVNASRSFGGGTSANMTLTLRAGAVSEGNQIRTVTIRLAGRFPDGGSVDLVDAFTHNISNPAGIAVTPERILILKGVTNSQRRFHYFTHSGNIQRAEETIVDTRASSVSSIVFFNERFLLGGNSINLSQISKDLSRVDLLRNQGMHSVTHTRLGITGLHGSTIHVIQVYPHGETDVVNYDVDFINTLGQWGPQGIAHSQDILYLATSVVNSIGHEMYIVEINDDDSMDFIGCMNVSSGSAPYRGFAIYEDTLYCLRPTNVQTIDIRPYRPMKKNTKTTIYPVFADKGETIDLTQYAPDAKRILFDVGYKKPSYLSINNNRLTIASNAVTKTTAVLVKCRGINYIDSAPFSFYLIIRQAARPVVKQVDELTMRAGSSYDLNALVEKESGLKTPPTIQQTSGPGRVSDGIFTIGNSGGRANFNARNATGTTNFSINILLLAQNTGDLDTVSETFRHRVEIAGVDVTHDVLVFPRVSARLDVPRLNQYTADNLTLTFRSDSSNDYHYNDGISGNFWETHSLNAAGFRERINVFFESFVNGRWVSHLVFAGRILETTEDIAGASVRMTCVDLTGDLRGTDIRDFGTLEKWDALRQRSDEVSYAGEYTPEGSLLPMQRRAGEQVWKADGTKITLRELALKSEGIAPASQAYLTPSVLLTAGGFLEEPPLLKFKGQHRAEDVRFLLDQLGLNGETPYNVEVDVPAVSLSTPTLLNRGSVSFSVEDTRVTRLLTDWVYDSTNRRILMLLSNPEGHIEDVLAQYNLDRDNYRLLYVFNRGVKAHRIARRNSTDYYILTSGAISQDRSAAQVPRPTDKTAYAYDSLAQGSNIRIHRFNASTGALTQHVARNNARPPQLGIHAYVGFENDLYVDEFEGIVPHYRGAFKWQGSHLYYRYAKDGEFGVARVNASGTTERLVHETNLGRLNHLNFAFDVTSGGVVYFVHAVPLNTLDIEVVRTTATTPDGNANIADDLSSYDTALELEVNLISYTNSSHGVAFTITGTDRDGNSQTETFGRAGSVRFAGNWTLNVPGRWRTITQVSYRGFSSGRFNVKVKSTDGIGLTIKRSGTTTPILASFKTLETLTDLDSTGGVFLGCHEALFHNNQLYLLVPIQRVNVDDSTPPEYSSAREKAAGLALYRCNVTAGSPSLTLLESWDFVHYGACNLHVHEGNVHFMEHPPSSAQYRAINKDIDTYEKHYQGSGDDKKYQYSIIPEPLGKLKRINANGSITDLGNLRYTDRAFNIAATRPLSIGSDLHLAMSYGDLRSLLRYNSLPSQADNVQHIVRTRDLRYIVPEFQPSGDRYTALAELALKVNASLSFSNGLIQIKDRSLFRAKTDGSTGTGGGSLSFDEQNKAFPSSGYLKIGDEFLRYTGISGGAFTGVSRGELGTSVVDHADKSEIFHIDTVISADRISSESFNIGTDVSRLHNVITVPDGSFDVRDADSIARHGEKPYSLGLGLTRHETDWVEQVFAAYLRDLKDLHQIVNLRLKPSNFLELGNVIGFRYAELLYAVQIISITKGGTTTEIQARTL